MGVWSWLGQRCGDSPLSLRLASVVSFTLALSSAQGRRGWRTPWPWWAALLWALLTSPLWIWNQQHGWASFAFHSARPGGGLHYDPGGSLLFLLAQVGLLFPSIGLLLLAMLGMHPPGGDRSRRATRLLRWLAWPQVIGFVLLAGRMQVMASWLVPAWWLLLPLAAGWLSRRRWGPGPLRLAGLATAVVVPPLLLLAAGQTRWGWLGAWLSTDRDPSAQLMHPDDLRRSLHSRPELWEALRHADVIASYRYDLPGFLALALRHQTRARFTAFSDDARGFPFWEPPAGLSGAQGVLFGVLEPGQPLHRRRFPAVPGPIEPLGMVQVRRSGQPSVVLEFARFGRLGGSDPRAVRRG